MGDDDPDIRAQSRPSAQPNAAGAPAKAVSEPAAVAGRSGGAGGGSDGDGGAGGGERYGRPGAPLRRGPFLIGFVGGLGVLAAYAAFLAARNAASMIVLIIIALYLAIGLNPAVERLRSWGLPRGLAVAVVALSVLLVLCGGVFALVPPVVTQSSQFIDQVPHYVTQLRRNELVNELVERFDLMERIQSAANADTLERALGGVFGGARLIFGTAFSVLAVTVLTIYFLAAFDRIKGMAYQLVPASRRDRARLLGDEILAKVGAYLVGAVAIALLAGVVAFVFASVTALPYPFALAVVVAVTALIPQIGATVGAIAVSLVAFATSLPLGIASIVFFIVYQQVENYLIYPRVMRRSVQVSDAAILVAALLGVALFGVIGALIAIPAVAALQLILREVVIPRQQTR